MRPVTAWLRLTVLAVVISLQSPKSPKPLLPAALSARWTCHLLRPPLPVTEAAMVMAPLPVAVAVGVPGLAGTVRNAGATASSFALLQLLSLYALNV